MSARDDIAKPLYPDTFYHIFNRGNNGENVFYNERNYLYFLKRYDFYLSNYLDTYAYCLMPNHFYLLVRVKPEKEIFNAAEEDLPKDSPEDLPDFKNLANLSNSPNRIISERFRLLFLSYAKAINKEKQRRGSLFQKPFRRKEVSNQSYLTSLIYYIHQNPVHHGFCDRVQDYQWNSFNSFLSSSPSKIKKHDVLNLFGNKQSFVEFHRRDQDLECIQSLIIEES